jgi:hypothetical protein
MKKTFVILLEILCAQLAQTAFAAEPKVTPPPPEVAKTAKALLGRWVGEATATTPFDKPETFKWTIECKLIAMGAGAECTSGGKASIGKMAQTCLLAFDPDGKSVHYMCVSSMGEVHDHRGQWKSDSIEYEPFQGGMSGQHITEFVKTSFPSSSTIVHTSKVVMGDGSSMSFEFHGRRE